MPLTPVLTAYSVTYNIVWYSAVMQWYSEDNETVENYTITLKHNDEICLTEIINANIMQYFLQALNYSTVYSVSVFATNCAGNGEPFLHTFYEG